MRNRDIEPFAVESDAIQLAWSVLPAREVVLELGDQTIQVDGTPPPWHQRWGKPLPADRGGPGAATFEDLEADTDYEVTVTAPGLPRRRVTAVRTLQKGPGRLLHRIATVGDCHIGQRRLGLRARLHDPDPMPEGLLPYAERGLQAALAEAQAWGAQTLIAKGDLTDEGRVREADRLIELFGEVDMPVHAILGNHDVRGKCDVGAALSSAGIDASYEVRAVDLPGVRVVLGHSPVVGSHKGRLEARHLDDLERLAGGTRLPVVVVLHHPPTRLPVPTSYPPGIVWRDSRDLARRLRRANPSVVVISGHTHRNRRYQVGGIDVLEVGSTKDYPGGWAGYSIYEGGIRQVVRRVARPDVIAWTDMTGRILGGAWAKWSPGTISQRCWTIDWNPASPEPRSRVDRTSMSATH